jgi:hypothetical protein
MVNPVKNLPQLTPSEVYFRKIAIQSEKILFYVLSKFFHRRKNFEKNFFCPGLLTGLNILKLKQLLILLNFCQKRPIDLF